MVSRCRNKPAHALMACSGCAPPSSRPEQDQQVLWCSPANSPANSPGYTDALLLLPGQMRAGSQSDGWSAGTLWQDESSNRQHNTGPLCPTTRQQITSIWPADLLGCGGRRCFWDRRGRCCWGRGGGSLGLGCLDGPVLPCQRTVARAASAAAALHQTLPVLTCRK